MHHPTDKVPYTTVFVSAVVDFWLEREIAQRVDHEGRCITQLHLAPCFRRRLVLERTACYITPLSVNVFCHDFKYRIKYFGPNISFLNTRV